MISNKKPSKIYWQCRWWKSSKMLFKSISVASKLSSRANSVKSIFFSSNSIWWAGNLKKFLARSTSPKSNCSSNRKIWTPCKRRTTCWNAICRSSRATSITIACSNLWCPSTNLRPQLTQEWAPLLRSWETSDWRPVAIATKHLSKCTTLATTLSTKTLSD